MKFRRLLALGLFLGVEAQTTGGSSGGSGGGSSVNEVTTPSTGGGGRASTTIAPTTTPPPSTPTTSAGGGGGSNTGGGDVTVTRTATVTGAGEGTVTVGTTSFTTITSTIVVVMTKFETTTVTENAETSTKVVYVTSTQWANQKRAIDISPRTVGPEYFAVEAIPTAAPAPAVVDVDANVFELIRHRRGKLFKRATITEFVTVTVGSGAGRTVTNPVTQTVISTVSEETTTTSLVTSIEAANAKTTITITSTLIITSTAVTTGVVQTATVAPTGSYGPDGTGGANNGGSNNSSGGGGLSTGAKAGIGAGCGVAGLIVIGGLIWFCVKKRRDNRNKFDSDDMFGSSEVPVGPAGRTQPAMASQHDRDVAAGIISPRPMPPKPSSPEGYRGTAPGDGRAGFAKPDAFGTAYTAASPETMYSRTASAKGGHPDIPEMQSPANTAELATDGGTAKWNEPNAAEIDGNQVTSTTGSVPPPHVYEMPAQNYK